MNKNGSQIRIGRMHSRHSNVPKKAVPGGERHRVTGHHLQANQRDVPNISLGWPALLALIPHHDRHFRSLEVRAERPRRRLQSEQSQKLLLAAQGGAPV